MVAGAKMKGPERLIALDLSDDRLEVAKRCGADIGINPKKEDAIQKVLNLTGGYGCDVYIEATGHPAAVEQGLHMIRKLGTFVEFSVTREQVTTDWTINWRHQRVECPRLPPRAVLLPSRDPNDRERALTDG
jgi:threonine dehydrogenase-like Zn-dependent dehydrogenase